MSESGIIVDPDMKEKVQEVRVKVSDLHNKPGVVMAVLIDENNVIQIVFNSKDEFYLWGTWKRLENAISYFLQQEELKRRAGAIQSVPANVLDKLREGH